LLGVCTLKYYFSLLLYKLKWILKLSYEYTTINNKFIEDFSYIIKEEYFENYNDFLIDSELLRKMVKNHQQKKNL
jgi:hypothetical protein